MSRGRCRGTPSSLTAAPAPSRAATGYCDGDSGIEEDMTQLTVAAAATQGPPPDSCCAHFSLDGVQQHNILRSYHGVPPVTLSGELSHQAQTHATMLADLRLGEEWRYSSCASTFGENILFLPYIAHISSKHASLMWYRQVRDVDFSSPNEDTFARIRNFSQIIWRETTEVGFGISYVRRGGVYVVANYRPRMELNFESFLQNVPPPSVCYFMRSDQLKLWRDLHKMNRRRRRGLTLPEHSPLPQEDAESSPSIYTGGISRQMTKQPGNDTWRSKVQSETTNKHSDS